MPPSLIGNAGVKEFTFVSPASVCSDPVVRVRVVPRMVRDGVPFDGPNRANTASAGAGNPIREVA